MASIAEPGQEITLEELQLATRNRGMPLEGLRYDITPVGMHYLLIHFDVPDVDASSWRLRIGGLVARPIELTLDELRSGPGRHSARCSTRPGSRPRPPSSSSPGPTAASRERSSRTTSAA
jgi:DMSO/TMAO reductase YedYZ molybdopterin-dependent catalytic subunit